MKKYEVYISSSYRYLNTKEKALVLAKQFLTLGMDVTIKEKEIADEK